MDFIIVLLMSFAPTFTFAGAAETFTITAEPDSFLSTVDDQQIYKIPKSKNGRVVLMPTPENETSVLLCNGTECQSFVTKNDTKNLKDRSLNGVKKKYKLKYKISKDGGVNFSKPKGKKLIGTSNIYSDILSVNGNVEVYGVIGEKAVEISIKVSAPVGFEKDGSAKRDNQYFENVASVDQIERAQSSEEGGHFTIFATREGKPIQYKVEYNIDSDGKVSNKLIITKTAT